jgi:hypothetical protein
VHTAHCSQQTLASPQPSYCILWLVAVLKKASASHRWATVRPQLHDALAAGRSLCLLPTSSISTADAHLRKVSAPLDHSQRMFTDVIRARVASLLHQSSLTGAVSRSYHHVWLFGRVRTTILQAVVGNTRSILNSVEFLRNTKSPRLWPPDNLCFDDNSTCMDVLIERQVCAICETLLHALPHT